MLVAAGLAAVLLTSACSGPGQSASTNPSTAQNKGKNSKLPAPPPGIFVKIVFDIAGGELQGQEAYQGEYKPVDPTVPVGTTVTFENDENYLLAPHTVTSKDGLFDKELRTGESFNYTFSKPGTYAYYCKDFPTMSGEIIVQ